MRKFSDKIRREYQKRILCLKTFFRKSCRLRDNVEKYGTVGQATDGIMGHVLQILNN